MSAFAARFVGLFFGLGWRMIRLRPWVNRLGLVLNNVGLTAQRARRNPWPVAACL